MSDGDKNTVKFSFDETEADCSTMMARFKHFLKVTDPKYFMMGDAEIEAGVATVLKYKEMASKTPDGLIEVTHAEKASILNGIDLMNSSTNDIGKMVPRPFRMCGFVPVNIPILCGMLLSPPTIFNTVFWQWAN